MYTFLLNSYYRKECVCVLCVREKEKPKIEENYVCLCVRLCVCMSVYVCKWLRKTARNKSKNGPNGKTMG